MRGARSLLRVSLPLAFFAVVGWLLAAELRELDWASLGGSIRRVSARQVGLAVVLTAAAYLTVAVYDRLALEHFGHEMAIATSLPIAFVSYAFNFNIGAIAGAVGFRYRLYSKAGLGKSDIAAIIGFSVVTNWLGCLNVLGATLLVAPSTVADRWSIPGAYVRAAGALALLPVAAYLAGSWARVAVGNVGGWRGRLPDVRVAVAQLVAASCFWLCVPAVIYVLRPPTASTISYVNVATTYAMASLGGLVVRVPAGLGVLEAIFVQVLRDTAGTTVILAMLVAYRGVFLLAPLVIAAITLSVLELRTSRSR